MTPVRFAAGAAEGDERNLQLEKGGGAGSSVAMSYRTKASAEPLRCRLGAAAPFRGHLCLPSLRPEAAIVDRAATSYGASVSESRLASPSAVVAATRTVLSPAVSGTAMDVVAQVSQFAVTGKVSEPRAVPLTEIVAGRGAAVPLA
jgi:hypothetical protein